MYQIGKQGLGQSLVSQLSQITIDYYYVWEIRHYHEDGGLKNVWYMGQDDIPITTLEFEINERLMGSATINFTHLEFPIDADDYFEFYYKGEKKYRGLVDVDADPKGGKVKLSPYHIRMKELLINSTYTTKTIIFMLEDIITDLQSDTGIIWNAGSVDITDTDTFTIDYSGYETAHKIIDELVKKLDDKRWGVDENNIFTVYTPNTATDEVYFNNDNPIYSKIDVKNNWTKVKNTRYQVFKKTTGAGDQGTERIGEVGYGGSYPELEIENFIRKKEGKYNVSEVITSDSEALSIAYNNLIWDTRVPQNIKVSDFDLDRKFPVIGEKWLVEDEEEYQLRTIVNCEALTEDSTNLQGGGEWHNATLDPSDFITGSNSITFDNVDVQVYYDFDTIIKWYNPKKLGFMIKGSIAGNYLQVKFGDSIPAVSSGTCSIGTCSAISGSLTDVLSSSFGIPISTGGVWSFVSFDITNTDWRYLLFEFTDTSINSTINIDRIQLFQPYKRQYTENVVQAKIKIDRSGDSCNVTMDEIDLQANDVIFAQNKMIKNLESIAQEN